MFLIFLKQSTFGIRDFLGKRLDILKRVVAAAILAASMIIIERLKILDDLVRTKDTHDHKYPVPAS